MHLIIVEDLKPDREKLSALIQEDCARQGENANLTFYVSGEEYLTHYQPKTCDGLFLDVILGGQTGITVAQKVRETEPRLPIIFTTTERDYAVEGFTVNATDYLLKPLNAEKVARCMSRLREYLTTPATISLLETAGRGHSAPVEIALDQLQYAQCYDHAIDVHTTSGVYRIRSTFHDLTTRLPQTGQFKVCGRSLVVNLSQITRVLDNELLLKTGERLTFSRNRRQEVQKAYADWQFARSRKGGWA